MTPSDGSDGSCLHDGKTQTRPDTELGAMGSPFLLMVTITDPERVQSTKHRLNTFGRIGSSIKGVLKKLIYNILFLKDEVADQKKVALLIQYSPATCFQAV